MRDKILFAVLVSLLGAAGCSTSSSGNSGGALELGYALPKRVDICHGYACTYRAKLNLDANDGEKFKAILSEGAESPADERAAIARADQYFEERAYSVTGIRDRPRAEVTGQEKGQMDCVDESTNTNTLLVYLAERGLLKYHKVARKETRGFFIDGRYPHWTAVISDPAGVKWVVDSWYAPMGGSPDIIPLSEWKPRGYLTSGALDS
jgi:hypothetical protein